MAGGALFQIALGLKGMMGRATAKVGPALRVKTNALPLGVKLRALAVAGDPKATMTADAEGLLAMA